MYCVFLHGVMTLYDPDDDTKVSMMGFGSGSDMKGGDKAIYKAITGCLKYIIKENFLIAESDSDPESDVYTRIPSEEKGKYPSKAEQWELMKAEQITELKSLMERIPDETTRTKYKNLFNANKKASKHQADMWIAELRGVVE
jgi:hypothetical protein